MSFFISNDDDVLSILIILFTFSTYNFRWDKEVLSLCDGLIKINLNNLWYNGQTCYKHDVWPENPMTGKHVYDRHTKHTISTYLQVNQSQFTVLMHIIL